MDISNYNTEHVKGKHLTYEDHHLIQIRLNDGWSVNRIAVEDICICGAMYNQLKSKYTFLHLGTSSFEAYAAALSIIRPGIKEEIYQGGTHL